MITIFALVFILLSGAVFIAPFLAVLGFIIIMIGNAIDEVSK